MLHDSATLRPAARPARCCSTAAAPASPIRSPSPASAQALFPRQANGSLIERDGKVVGSALIGQALHRRDRYFHGRPVGRRRRRLRRRRARPAPTSARPNPALIDARARPTSPRCARRPGNAAPVPADLVTASGSRPRPAHLPGGRRFQVGARRRGARPARGRRSRALVDGARRGPRARPPRRAARQRARAQPRARRRGAA